MWETRWSAIKFVLYVVINVQKMSEYMSGYTFIHLTAFTTFFHFSSELYKSLIFNHLLLFNSR